MSELQSNIQAFADGQIPIEALNDAVKTSVREDDSASSNIMMQLSQAHVDGVLSAGQCHELLSLVITTDRFNVTAAIELEDGEKTQAFRSRADEDVTTVGVGSMIKDRFLLEEKLGQGGMGVVYKARDRIRVEAKDRNPSVAVKVLNEDFKDHPESFIALQRECSKAQRLAHPNIATVYDFDRTGGMAFMTMELLSGQPLNMFFAEDLPEEGLSFEEAWPLLKGLGDALGYAHKNNIVHSDFKPANAFICDDGQVKVIDFGIAQAVKKPGETQFTHFNASTLGALTPAYASPEMLEGEDPDPRDDIYALGVVAYIMMSGDHPYKRNAANIAAAMKMRPKPIPKLTRLQNLALERALNLEREYRTRTTGTFLSDLQGESASAKKQTSQSRIIAALAAGFALMTACVIYLLLR